ncbi:putative CCR4-associated factor 1 11 [Zea mays]|jgi:CCR4-NOT transcription complex subunit 7/8|uniref:poly(A)-specific ribonuclease n=2 Tax=Zea mays TaxID=4577 RepID=A0A1D6F7T7_MAIZE|nr:Putative CCR4-associated factor 1 homolog 3 [Zea mays]PWZ40855.1 putative CCR4-associated factor 1 11 [Zea mays]|eukprot:XP_008671941.1 probable CCR4-associated factor 1 homolog 11 [Zea mays]
MFPPPAPVIPAPAMVGRLQFVSVGASNFATEMDFIGSLLPRFRYIAIDAEYPGTVHGAPAGAGLSPAARYYAVVKANVEELPVLQLGLTICDEEGNLPVVMDVDGLPLQIAWEFHFSDFDVARDPHSVESVNFLRAQGFDFVRARAHGVASADFAGKLAALLASVPRWCQPPAWVAFGGAFDFAFMVKMLSGGQPLPENPQDMVARASDLLRGPVFDAKYMAEHCGRPELCVGGLRTVAAILGVPQLDPAPPSLAGPKSHTACRIYYNVMRMLEHDGAGYDGLIDGLY